MKRVKWIAVCLVLALSCAAWFVGCGGNNGEDPNGGQQDDGYGTLTIDDVTVYIDSEKHYTFAEIEPVFSVPEKAEALTYTYDTSAIKIEDNTVTPLKRQSETVNVRASSEHFSVIFRVDVEYINLSSSENPLYDVSDFASGIASGAAKCADLTENSTLFIGDSFMDDYFIGDYMATYAADKDVLNAGISSTTSYHWESVFSDIIGSTAPGNIVLHVGTNNFYDAHDGVEFTEASLTRLLTYLHTSYPSSKIWWFNITQRADTSYASQVTETNAYMAEWCSQYDWVTCVDTCSEIDSSMLRDDGVHPKTETYSVFTDALVAAGCEIAPKA